MTVSYGMSIMCLITIYALSPSYRPVCDIVLYRTPTPPRYDDIRSVLKWDSCDKQ